MVSKIAHQPTPKQLFLWMLLNPEQPQLVGQLFHQSNGDCALRYAPAWMESGFALSLDMPLLEEAYVPIHHHLRESGAPGCAAQGVVSPHGLQHPDGQHRRS